MIEKKRTNRTAVSTVFVGLAMILSFPGFSLLLVAARQSIPTVDEDRSKQRLKILADLNAENERILYHYRWIDKAKGVVGVPIDRAMDMLYKPHPLGSAVKLASANSASPKGQSGDQTSNGNPASAGDPEAGEIIFKQCAACHSLDPDTNKQGPTLAGIFGRPAGSVEDFNYSDANKNSGVVWNEAILRKYLANPQAVVPGTKMTFPGLKDPQQVEDVIAYLKIATKT